MVFNYQALAKVNVHMLRLPHRHPKNGYVLLHSRNTVYNEQIRKTISTHCATTTQTQKHKKIMT